MPNTNSIEESTDARYSVFANRVRDRPTTLFDDVAREMLANTLHGLRTIPPTGCAKWYCWALSLVDKCLYVYVGLPTSGEDCLGVLLIP